MPRWMCTVALALLCGCGGSSTGSNQDAAVQQDAPSAQVDASTDGAATTDGGAAFRAHRGSATLSGAVQATSPRYRVIMSTGQSPGGNNTAATDQYRVRGGLVGATQGP